MTQDEIIAELDARCQRDCRQLAEEEQRAPWIGQEARLRVLRAWLRTSQREWGEALYQKRLDNEAA